uniref:Mating-type protein beta 1 n=1 Tax=Coprinopsis cinerea TaxID=5346 RepID=Q9Y7A4_COPCI|nr:mating-type protein beta 1 [Coprinopsis cinerea]
MSPNSGSSPNESPDCIVRRTLKALRKDFVAIIRGESTAYDAFLRACSQFDSLAHSCHESLSDETMEMILDFSAPLEALSTSMVELENQKEVALNQLDLAELLSTQTAALKLTEEENDAPLNTTPYIEPCARWLKDNCHNPYPSQQVRSEIATQTRTARKDIDAWFIDARRRIGWNELRRKHFNNKRAEIVRAASIFFNADPTHAELDKLPSFVENELAGVLAAARSLYEEKFSRSKLAAKLDSAVKDMTPSLKTQLKNEKVRRREEEAISRDSKRGRHAYPTPERSPASTVERLRSPSSVAIDVTSIDCSPIASRKRRRSLDSYGADIISPAPKRPRSQPISRELSIKKGLPSPALSTQDELPETSVAPSPQPSLLPNLTPTDSTKSTGKRKRHLSDGFQYPAAKRPQIRPQVVSDPFPAASGEDWDQWFREHVLSSPELTLTGDIPPPVTVDTPDSNTPLDIELFNFPLIPDLPPSVPAASAPAAELSVVEPLEVPATAQVAADPAATALDPAFSWMTNDLPPPLQPTNTFPSPTDMYINSTPFTTLGTVSQPFLNIQNPAFLPDQSLWSNISVSDLDFSALFNQPSTCSTMAVPIQVPSQPISSTSKALSEQEREAKRKELEELEARAQAIRAEISAP